jgi:hypothetical protein
MASAAEGCDHACAFLRGMVADGGVAAVVLGDSGALEAGQVKIIIWHLPLG